MPAGNRLVFIKQVLYRLKRRYGEAGRLLRRVSVDVDRATGVKDTEIESLYLPRIIVLPNVSRREFFYDLTFIASNKNFTYGGHVGTNERKIILDRRDLYRSNGTEWKIEVGQWFNMNGKRYEVGEIQEFEDARAYLVTGKACDSAPADSEINVEVTDMAALDQSAEGEIT